MSFFAKFGKPEIIKASKSLTPKELLQASIDKQRRLLAGEEVLGALGKPIRSWFRQGVFKPTVGVYGLFGEAAVRYKTGVEKEMLDELEISLRDGELDEYFKRLPSNGVRKKV